MPWSAGRRAAGRDRRDRPRGGPVGGGALGAKRGEGQPLARPRRARGTGRRPRLRRCRRPSPSAPRPPCRRSCTGGSADARFPDRVIDSVGIGGAPDAAAYFNGDARYRRQHAGPYRGGLRRGPGRRGRSGPLRPADLDGPRTLARRAAGLGATRPGLGAQRAAGAPRPKSRTARTRPRATGNWPACRCPGTGTTFPTPRPFPSLTRGRSAAGGDRGASLATARLGHGDDRRLGAEHMRSGWPICYTSADSVFQIAAHEQAFRAERLLDLCEALAPPCTR